MIDFRLSTAADFDSFYECFAGICRERRFLALVEPPSKEDARIFVDEARRRGMIQYVAVEGSCVVGWCDVIPIDLDGCRHVGRLGMGIVPEFRGQGIGLRLVEVVVKGAREAGLARVELDVYSSNTPAIRLYERFGFVHEGAHRRARIIDGRVDDIMLMGLLLDDPSSGSGREWR